MLREVLREVAKVFTEEYKKETEYEEFLKQFSNRLKKKSDLYNLRESLERLKSLDNMNSFHYDFVDDYKSNKTEHLYYTESERGR